MKVTEHEAALRYLTLEPDDFDSSRQYPLVVLLHGRGSHMGDLAGLAPVIDSQGYVYVCPNAPLVLDIGFGATGYEWAPYPTERIEQTHAAVEMLTETVDEAMDTYEVAPGRLVLGGFSQGGVLSYVAGMQRPDLYGGVAAMSAYIPVPGAMRTMLPEQRSQAIFASHGTDDGVIPIEKGREARRFLEDEGYSPEYREYPIGHEITGEVVSDLVRWLHSVLPTATAGD